MPNIMLPELNNFIAGKVLFEADFDTRLGFNPPTEFDCPRGQTPGTKVPPLNTTPPASPMFTAGSSFTNMTLAAVARAAVEEGSATGSEWRTCPLWGNGTGASVMCPTIDAFDPNGNPPPGGTYLHDGRARSTPKPSSGTAAKPKPRATHSPGCQPLRAPHWCRTSPTRSPIACRCATAR